MPSTRNTMVGLAAGVLHAAVLLGVAIDLGYAVGPGEYAPGEQRSHTTVDVVPSEE